MSAVTRRLDERGATSRAILSVLGIDVIEGLLCGLDRAQKTGMGVEKDGKHSCPDRRDLANKYR